MIKAVTETWYLRLMGNPTSLAKPLTGVTGL